MVQNIAEKIVWLGHAGFRIDGEKTVYFDPYQISSGKEADLILISHEHFDHCSPEDVAKIQKSDTIIVTEKGSVSKLSGDVREIKVGEALTLDNVKVEAVPSYNTNKEFHPKKNGWLGFIVELNGVRIYHSGDTDYIPEMADYNVDIAFLPVSGAFVMTADEAAEAALSIKPKIAIPMHYGSVAGTDKDAENFKNALEGKVDVMILPKSG